jgi:uncharacterized protein (TIGR03382 family)
MGSNLREPTQNRAPLSPAMTSACTVRFLHSCLSGYASMLFMRSALVVALLAVPAGYAEAHIHLTKPTPRTDSLQGDQKDQHCGVANQQRNPARVSTFKPGDTITVEWMETIQHPGYFRIAFQPAGAVFSIPPATAGNCGAVCPAGVTNCNFPNQNLTGMMDAATGSYILADQIADGTLSTTVTLPNMECDNCTLQFIQVMTDKCPYTIDAASDDIYFNCADITLAANAPDAGMTGMPDAGTGGGGSNNDGQGGELSGGCSTGNTTGLGALALLGLVGLLRRRH